MRFLLIVSHTDVACELIDMKNHSTREGRQLQPTNQQVDLTRFVGFSGVLHSWIQIFPQKNLTREGSFEGRVRIQIVVLWTKSQQSLGLWLVGAEGLEPPTC